MGNKIPKPATTPPEICAEFFDSTAQPLPTENISIHPAKKGSLSTRDPKHVTNLFNKYSLHSKTESKSTAFIVDLPGIDKAEIHRAGTILVTPSPSKSRPFKSLQNLMADNSSPKLSDSCGTDYVIILGTDIFSSQENHHLKKAAQAHNGHAHPWSSWFSGRCKELDGNYVETIIRETFEESAGVVALTEEHVMEAIEEGRFFYSTRHKILTIIIVVDNNEGVGLRRGSFNGYKVTEFNRAVQQLSEQNDYVPHTISARMLEMEEYHAVKLTDFILLINRLWNMTWPKNEQMSDPFNEAYHIKSLEGKTLRIQYHYATCLALPEAKKAFKLIENLIKSKVINGQFLRV